MFQFKVPAAIAAAAALAVMAPAAQAAVNITFTGVAGAAGEIGDSQFRNTFFPNQLTLINSLTPTTPFAFTFQYDPATALVTPGGYFPVTLVSGQVGAMTDFSAFSARVVYSGGANATQDVMSFSLLRTDFTATNQTYNTQINFTLVDDQGLLFAGPTALPGSINPASLEQANSEFRIYRSAGVGVGIRTFTSANIGVTSSVTGGSGDPPAGPVPEPATWAMMILGFGAAGSLIRRRRALA